MHFFEKDRQIVSGRQSLHNLAAEKYGVVLLKSGTQRGAIEVSSCSFHRPDPLVRDQTEPQGSTLFSVHSGLLKAPEVALLWQALSRCMLRCMRTNIVLDDQLVRDAMQYTSAPTKRALVDEALRTFIEVKAEEQRRRSYVRNFQALEPHLRNLRLSESSAEILRADRDRP